MQLQDKIELIRILSKKLNIEKFPDISEDNADMILNQLKEEIIEVAREEFDIAKRKERTKHYLKIWCKSHNVDYESLRT